MKKTLITILLSVLTISLSFAQQTGTLTATLVDKSGIPIAGATVELIPATNKAAKQHTSSLRQGDFSLSLVYGEYDMKITYLGYESINKTVKIDKAKVDLGKIEMKQTSIMIDGVSTMANAIRTSQKGDTVVYNADAFKVAKDADTEGLLAKMPGITIIDGNVEAQGETVKKVFVDGKEFFGSDVSATIKNLPAEMVSKIEVYNKLSDQAEFSGVDDGEGFKAINIVTNRQTGRFGKMYAGYGFNDKYMAGASVNLFKSAHRVSLVGSFNNVNQQSFSTEDILSSNSGGSMGRGGGGVSLRGGGYMRGMAGYAPQSGKSTNGGIGINYTGKLSEKIDFQGSYNFSARKNENESVTDRIQSLDNGLKISDIIANSTSYNYNHRFDGKIDYKINEKNIIMIRPGFNIQTNESQNYSLTDVSKTIGNDTTRLSSLERNNSSDGNGYNMSLGAVYRTKFEKPGRTITIEASGNMRKNDRDSYNNSILSSQPNFTPNPTGILKINNTNSYRVGGKAMYTEPVGESSQLVAQYDVRYNFSDADTKAYSWDQINSLYGPDFVDSLSNVYNSGYITHNIGPGYRYANKTTTYVANVNYQYSSLTKNQDYPILANQYEPVSFSNIVYFSMLNVNIDKTNSLRAIVRSFTRNPEINQLQKVKDITDPQIIDEGNPDLLPSYSNLFRLSYNKSSVTRGRSFMAGVGFDQTNNHITDLTLVTDTLQFSMPVNMNGLWNARVNATFGTPVKFLRSNLNFNAEYSYGKSPSYYNSLKNIATRQSVLGGATLSSNISDKIDFTISYNTGYSTSFNTENKRSDDKYWNQAITAKFKWVTWQGITLSGNGGYNRYTGITRDFNDEYEIINLYVGKKIFKSQRGEIIFGVNNLTNNTRNFTRNITDKYTENVRTQTIGRYFGFQFVYNLRSFGKMNDAPRNSEFGPGSGMGMGMGGGRFH